MHAAVRSFRTPAFMAILALAYTTGAHEERSRGLLAMLVAASVFLVQDGMDLEAGYPSVRQDFGFYILVFLAWGAGVGIRALRQRAEQLERLTDPARARARAERAPGSA